MSGSIRKESFGTTKNKEDVDRYSLVNKNGVCVTVLTFGGIIHTVNIPTPGAGDQTVDITAGYDTVAEYEGNTPYFGAIIGRVVNRIDKGRFELDGTKYQLPVNDDGDNLHGGLEGWNKKVWAASIEGEKLVLHYISPDGDENFPGQVNVTVTYELNDENELFIHYTATSDKATPINLTNHAYWNLAGHKAANVYDHTIQMFAASHTPKVGSRVPTGEIVSVKGTLYDLQEKTSLGERIPLIKADIKDSTGFDMNYCVDGEGEKKLAARVEHAASGRGLEVYTNQPGTHLYTGCYLDGEAGKDKAVYQKHSSLALETQNYPDAINKPNFPSSVLRPGETYDHKCWFKFITL